MMIKEKLRNYIEAAGESSRRSRTFSVILITASILFFMAFWNSAEWSWNKHRMKIYEDVIKFWPLDKEDKDFKKLHKNDESLYKRYKKAKKFAKEKFHYDHSIYKGKENDIENFRQIVMLKLSALQDIRSGGVINIEVPFFGTSFDINDLGIFSGITFFIILLMLGYSLSREHENIAFFTNEIDDIESKHYYYSMLATKQVLTVPPKELSQERFWKIWKIMPRILVWVPVIINFSIVFNDCITIKIGENVSCFRAWLGVFLGGTFFIIVFLIAYRCNKIWKTIDKEWENMFKKVSGNNINSELKE